MKQSITTLTQVAATFILMLTFSAKVSAHNLSASSAPQASKVAMPVIDTNLVEANNNIAQSINVTYSSAIQIMPSFSSNAIEVSMGFKSLTDLTAALLTEDGKVVKAGNYSLAKGETRIKMDGVLELPDGIYIVKITDKKSGKEYYQQFLKF